MRVAAVHTRFLLYWPARLRVLARALEGRGDELVVVEVASSDSTYPFAETECSGASGTKWYRLFEGADQRTLKCARVSRAIWRALEELEPDVIIATAIAFPTGATAVRWARQRKRGVVIMDDARMQDVPRTKLVNCVKRRVYRNVDAVLIPAPSHAPSYVHWGVPRRHIFYGVNVVDNDRYAERAATARKESGTLRMKHGLPDGFFLGIGRQVAKKNWRALLAAYHEYRGLSEDEPWGLVLVGDGPERASLEASVKGTGIRGVRLRPFCSPDDTCTYYALASALVVPSFGETWGLVVNEAMACGLPVLVSEQCGCAGSLVQDGENGWTFPPDNPKHLASLLQGIAGLSDGEREKMGARSREIIAEWPLERFAEGALGAIDACKDVSRGFRSLADRLLLALWKGRYRPT